MNKNTLHFLGGTILAGFVLLHLSNHLLSLAGTSAHIEAMELLRKIYRQPILETILLGTVAS